MLKKDKKIAINTSSNGDASGTPKFHAITPINQIKYTIICLYIRYELK